MKLIPVHTQDAHYAQAEALMLQAFPAEERRPTEQQRFFTDHQPLFHPHVLMEGDKFIGILNYWTLDDFVYVEHLATDPALRGGGLGSQALHLLAEQADCPIVLEVEPPTYDLAIRRIEFYRRNGYRLWEAQSYIQPPYTESLCALPLLLMVKGALDEQHDFARIRKLLHLHVYGLNEPLTEI